MLRQMADAVGAPAEEFARLWSQDTRLMRWRGEFRTIEENLEYICRALGVSATAEAVARAACLRTEATPRWLTPREDAVDTLTRLKAAGHKIGLISDCTCETPARWPDTPFASLIDVPIFSCEVRLTKPDPRIYRLACERLNVEPRECVYVGDGGSGELTGAAGVGMSVVLIRCPDEPPSAFDRADAANWRGPTISALSDLLRILGLG